MLIMFLLLFIMILSNVKTLKNIKKHFDVTQYYYESQNINIIIKVKTSLI